MKKVLFVVDEKRMGGVSVLLEDICKIIDYKLFKVDILVLHNNGDSLKNVPKNVSILYATNYFNAVDLTLKECFKTKNISVILNKFRIVLAMKNGSIISKIKKERNKMNLKNYDTEIAFKDGFCALFTFAGNSKKKYHWLHTDYSMFDCTQKYHKLFARVFLGFDKIIAISSSVKDRFLKKYPNSDVLVINNLVNVKKVREKALEYDVNYKKGFNIVSVGRFHNMKGYDRLINVFNRINSEKGLDNIYLHLIGDGPDFNLVKSLIEKNNLSEHIELLGKKDNPFPYVKASDLFFMCSRYEPFGLVVIEALALQVPVISTNVASIHEMLNKKIGIIVENNEEDMYNGIVGLIDNPKIIKDLKNNLKDYNYKTDEIIKQINDLLL